MQKYYLSIAVSWNWHKNYYSGNESWGNYDKVERMMMIFQEFKCTSETQTVDDVDNDDDACLFTLRINVAVHNLHTQFFHK